MGEWGGMRVGVGGGWSGGGVRIFLYKHLFIYRGFSTRIFQVTVHLFNTQRCGGSVE